MSILKVDIEGLDLVLGGGIHLLERLPGSGESATLLIRGPAGSGKTVLGTQLAASIARALQTDVAYGCVELLPTELRAQHELIRKPDSREQVIILADDKEANEPDASSVRLYTAVLDLGEEGDTVKRLGGAVEELLEAADRRAERKVRVVVVDSLSAGYGLGAHAPRVLADGICKLAAERGLIIILLEELAENESSVWSFAVDTVLELALVKQNMLLGRQLLIPKNRLGQSTAGPREFSFGNQRGVSIFPVETAYLSAWSSIELPVRPENIPWTPPALSALDWLPRFQASVTAVIGEDSATVRRVAFHLGRPTTPSMPKGAELMFMIGAHGFLGVDASTYSGTTPRMAGWHPSLTSGPQMLAFMRSWFIQARQKQRPLGRVIIGDLWDYQGDANASYMSVTIPTIALLLRRLGVPLVLFETVKRHDTRPLAASLADVVLTLRQRGEDLEARVTDAFGREDTVTLR